ncbi:MAG TPA: hypothetical protein VEK08_19575 [Planctomycetota bacterium]|nr:hypothetical protein [Planctomycetota bacterium]
MRLPRFHLSTAVTLMLAASILVGLNAIEQPPPALPTPNEGYIVTGKTYGWPARWYDPATIKPFDLSFFMR